MNKLLFMTSKKILLLLSILFLWTCGGGGSKAPTEPVEPAPVSNFTATPTSGLQPLEVVFTSTATGTIASYAWNVDADTDIEGTAATFTHTYTDAGTYGVTLTVTGPGGSNPKTVADMITVTSAAPTPTTATTQTTQEDGSTTISLTATDPNGQAVTFAITTDPTNGTATLSGTDITYTPNANFYGTDSVAYTASNGTYTSDPVTITITVTGEDDGNPTTNDVSATTDEDTAVTVNLDATEIDGDNYSFSIVTQPTNGTLGSVSGNQVEYTPNQDFNGTDTFTFEAADDRTFRRNVATATITVNAVNDAPVANDVTASMDENKEFNRFQPVTITLDATDVEGDALTYSVVSDVTSGTLGSISGTQIIYTPTQDFNGTDTFTYKANDGNADSNGATVTITIASVNDAPVTQNVSFTTDEDTPYTESYTAYVSDVDGDDLTVIAVTNPTFGTATCDGTDCTYTPNQDFYGTDSFTYKANDGELDSNVSTVTITVNAVNDAPVVNDVTASTTSRMGNMRQSVDIALSVTDADGDDLTISIVSDVSNGTTSLSGNVVTYTPNAGYDGTDTFTYKANDGTVDSNTATGTITSTPARTYVPDDVFEQYWIDRGDDDVLDDYVDTYKLADLQILNLQDKQVQDLTGIEDMTKLYSLDVDYTLVDTVDVSNNNNLVYLYAYGASQLKHVIFGSGQTAVKQIGFFDTDLQSLNVSMLTNLEQISARNTDISSLDISQNAKLTSLNFPHNKITTLDVSNNPLLNTLLLGSINGLECVQIAQGQVFGNLALPSSAYFSTDCSNARPEVSDISSSTDEDVAINITLNGTDEDGDTLTYTIVSDVSNGVTSLSGSTVTYTPTANWSGTDTFTYKVNDGTVDSNTSTVTITVASVDDAPTTEDATFTISEDRLLIETLSHIDVDGDGVTYSTVSGPSNGSISLTLSTGEFTYTPNTNFTGTDTFTYKVNDGTDDSNISTVNISVIDPFYELTAGVNYNFEQAIIHSNGSLYLGSASLANIIKYDSSDLSQTATISLGSGGNCRKMKVDSNGDIYCISNSKVLKISNDALASTWNFSHVSSPLDFTIQSDGIVIVGWGGNELHAEKIDFSDNSVWTQSFPGLTYKVVNENKFAGVATLANGEIVIGANKHVMKVQSSSGSIFWNKDVYDLFGGVVVSIQENSSNNEIKVATQNYGSGDYGQHILLFDQDGNGQELLHVNYGDTRSGASEFPANGNLTKDGDIYNAWLSGIGGAWKLDTVHLRKNNSTLTTINMPNYQSDYNIFDVDQKAATGYVNPVAVDSNGNIFYIFNTKTSGFTSDSSGESSFAIKIDSNGNVLIP